MCVCMYMCVCICEYMCVYICRIEREESFLMGKLSFSFPLGVSRAVSLLPPALGCSPVTAWPTWEQKLPSS